MCRQIDFGHLLPPLKSSFFHHHKQTLTAFFFTRVDKHKNASNKLLHFCPKKKEKRKKTTILEDNSLESNYAAHKFSTSICLCSFFEDVFLRSHTFSYFETICSQSVLIWHQSSVDDQCTEKTSLMTELESIMKTFFSVE